MAENKKYYFLKLKEDFFDQREIVVLEGSKDGILYVNILLKLYLKSLQHNGKLLLNEMTPLSAEMIALLTRHEVGTVERAMRAFMQLGLVVMQEDDTYYMPEIEQMTGKALMEKNIPVLMTSFPKLLNALGGIYSGEKNEYLKSLNRYQLLIIDDLGVERDTPYVLETVYLVIDERYKSGKPFIITTNLSLEKLQNPADLEHGRIYDRIMERCVPVAFSGKNYRTGKGRANIESASGILKA